MTLKTDIDQIAVDAGKLHDIVHGGPTAVVATNGGTVKSVAKAIADLEVQIVTEAGSYVDLCQDEVALATAQAQTATNQAAAAAGSALSAASVVAQDLSAIDRTVFASTTLVAVFRYNTRNDTDKGAWRKRCQHTAWYNQTLSGNYLGDAANEAAARAISGATTGSYYHNTTDGKFYKLSAGAGQTETFRGNRAEHPAEVLITVETNRAVIWDLTQAGCPMWAVLVQTGIWVAGRTATSVAARNGRVVIGTSTGVIVWRLIADLPTFVVTSGTYWKGSRDFNVSAGTPKISATAIVNDAVNCVAITVLPTAPVDVATGLPAPTIDVFTSGGLSRIKDDGTVVNSTNSGGPTTYYPINGATKSDRTAMSLAGTNNVQIGPGIATTGSGNPQPGFTAYTASSTPAILPSVTAPARVAAHKSYGEWSLGSSIGLNKLRENPASVAAGMIAYVSKDYNSGWQVGAIKGAWLADTVAETLTGTELVTNGTFATDTTGWTGSNATLSVVSAAMRLTAVASAAMSATQAITCVVGKSYVAALDVTAEASTGTMALAIGTTSGGTETGTAVLASGTGKLMVNFVATATTHYISAYGSAATLIGETFDVDNISCRLADVDRSVKAKGLQAFGSLTKAAVASGAALMKYSGFSDANHLLQPYNSDLDVGTGDFSIVGWIYKGATEFVSVPQQVVMSRGIVGGGGGAGETWAYERGSGAGFMRFSITGIASFDSSDLLGLSSWNLVSIKRQSGVIYHSINGRPFTSAGANATSLSSTSAVVKIGMRVLIGGGNPSPDGLALVRFSGTVPSDNQIKHIYETEKALFEAGAQCCLAGTSNAVTALAYDEETDLLHVGTSYGRSAFKGLVRVASEATPVGAIVALAAGAGVIAQAGATAVDVYVPAYSLREELLRDAEQMARFGQNLIAHDFTATASQTNFALPVGWEIVAVYQQGALKRETTSWTRSFDGFVWSAVLGTGATVSDWISILAKRV